MNTRHTSLTVQVSTDVEGAHLIHFRWPVTITELEFLEAARRLAYYTNCQAVRAKDCGLMTLPLNSSLPSCNALPDWTMRLMWNARSGQHSLQMNALIKISGQLVTYSRQPVRQCTLVLPSQIDFAGSIDTITRTLEATYFALSLYSGGGWREMRRGHYAWRKATKSLQRR